MRKGQTSKMSTCKRKKATKEINKLQVRQNNRVTEVGGEAIRGGTVGIEHCNPEGEPVLNAARHSKGGETKARVTDLIDEGPWKTKQYTDEDIPQLRKQWVEEYADIFQEQLERLPLPRSVKHRILLKDPDKEHQYYASKCPTYLRKELNAKVQKYLRAGWWIPCQTHQAAPMLCIARKDFLLRTVMDLRKRNDNTYNDVTPLPDQETIRNDMAKAKYRSKIDLSNVYEQVLVDDEYMKYTAFATIFGTFYSWVMQIGDCNAPVTFQRLMTEIFRDCIGHFIHVYLDDIFIFSNTIDEHQQHLKKVLDLLRANEFYLQELKVQLYAEEIDCLGHLIDKEGIHVNTDKMGKILSWRVPRNEKDMQKFLGLIQYLAPFLLDISAYTGPLSTITSNNQEFNWRPLHDNCFEQIKTICSKTPVLKPIDPSRDEPIWVICNTLVSEVGAMYGQGPTWQTCQPMGFMSKKFMKAQYHYFIYEQETLAVLEALMKWEDQLVGHPINIVTDHKALQFFKMQKHIASPRQGRWMSYLDRFRHNIVYVKGQLNKVADTLS